MEDPWFEVIGVVKDPKNQGLQEAPLPEAWVPYTVTGSGERGILVRTANDPLLLLDAVRKEIWATDRNVAVTLTGTLEGFISAVLLRGTALRVPDDDHLRGDRARARNHRRLQRDRLYRVAPDPRDRDPHGPGRGPDGRAQAGVRMGARLVVPGPASGSSSSLGLSRAIASQLLGCLAHDPATLASVAGRLLVIGLAACWVPARRATRVDPLVALRYE